MCLTFRACDAVFRLCPHAKHTDRSCLKKGPLQIFPPPLFLHLKNSLERHRSGEKRSEHMQICSTNRILRTHQEAHVTPFTSAEGGEGWKAGLCTTPVNAPDAGGSAWRFSVPPVHRRISCSFDGLCAVLPPGLSTNAQRSADYEGQS